jgi:Collagen triple helix repeat (20 copies)
MFSSARRRLGAPGVIAIIALVLAMAGGAWAAKGGVIITKLNQISPKVRTQLKGQTGPEGVAGPAGPAGPQGAKGEAGKVGNEGKAGLEGKEGKQGKSVAIAAEGKGANCKEGGQSFEVEGSSVKSYACNGSPWTAGGTLPKDATETGAWFARMQGSEAPFIGVGVIDLPIPLATELPGTNVKVVKEGAVPPAQCDDGVSPAAGPTHPEADSGFLCVFVAAEEETPGYSILKIASSGVGASTSGAMVIADSENEILFAQPHGTFAVTG